MNREVLNLRRKKMCESNVESVPQISPASDKPQSPMLTRRVGRMMSELVEDEQRHCHGNKSFVLSG